MARETNERLSLILAGWMNRRDQISQQWRLKGSPLAIPSMDETGKREASVNDFAKAHDDATRAFMSLFPDLNPVQWEALRELASNTEKML